MNCRKNDLDSKKYKKSRNIAIDEREKIKYAKIREN